MYASSMVDHDLLFRFVRVALSALAAKVGGGGLAFVLPVYTYVA